MLIFYGPGHVSEVLLALAVIYSLFKVWVKRTCNCLTIDIFLECNFFVRLGGNFGHLRILLPMV